MDKIVEKLSHIRDGFSFLDGQDRLVYLIDLGKKIDLIDAKQKVESNKVHACTSQTWINLKNHDDITITADSELSLIHI